MISIEDEYILGLALGNHTMASEIVARVIDFSPTPYQAGEMLKIISTSKKEEAQIREFLIVAFPSPSAGNELADLLELIVRCIEFKHLNLTQNNAELIIVQSKIKQLSKETRFYFETMCANKEVSTRILQAIEIAAYIAKNMSEAS
jgi:hypothetical protein